MTLVARASGARLAVAGTALAALTMLLGGCATAAGSSAGSVGTAPAVSPSGPPDGSAPAGSPDAPGGAVTPSPARTLTAPPAYGVINDLYPCPAAAVKVTVGLAQGTTAVTYQVIDFTNRGSKLCFLDGVPGVSLAGGTPLAQIGLAAPVPANVSPRPVPLNPGQVANALLQISNASSHPRAMCDPVHARYLVIAVPNDIGFVKLRYETTACAKPIELLSISAIVRGSGG
jgi:hypothetical protein